MPRTASKKRVKRFVKAMAVLGGLAALGAAGYGAKRKIDRTLQKATSGLAFPGRVADGSVLRSTRVYKRNNILNALRGR